MSDDGIGSKDVIAPNQELNHKHKKKRPLPGQAAKTVPTTEAAQVEATITRLSRTANNKDNNNNRTTTTTTALVRTLPPYLYTFTSFAKGRWVGRTVLDVYTDEFGSYPASYYRAAIQQGRIQVNSERVSIDYLLDRRDELTHTVHRHEPAVVVGTDESPYFTIVAETDEIVAVDKPAAIPIHACGAYHRNSLVSILEHETRLGKLYTIHRLDRLTSGLVILAKCSRVAKVWAQAIADRTCEKIYLARVKGRFGANVPVSNVPCLQHDGATYPVLGEYTDSNPGEDGTLNETTQSLRKRYAHGYWIADGNGKACTDDDDEQQDPWAVEHAIDELLQCLDNRTDNDNQDTSRSIKWLTLACPVRLEQPKNGVCASGPFTNLDDAVYVKTVKPAQTSFAVVRYLDDDDTTLIMARPATGRTHQIRLHLQHLGHAIANDPNYGGDMWFGDNEGRALSEMAQVALAANTSMMISSSVPATEDEVCIATSTKPSLDETLEETVKRTCVWCARLGSLSAEQQALQEFQVRSPGLWLHALRYRISNDTSVIFQTTAPKWAVERCN